jgi:hypothetical protein
MVRVRASLAHSFEDHPATLGTLGLQEKCPDRAIPRL